jgi:tetratricopeptide (TPR) repeat protein
MSVVQRISVLTVLAAVVLGAAGCNSGDSRHRGSRSRTSHLHRTTPNPSLDPKEVVRLQLEALRNNDSEDSGIRIAFGFSSSSQHESAESLGRFTAKVKDPLYRPMLSHESEDFEATVVHGDSALQKVRLTGPDGRMAVYAFYLSRPHIGQFMGCWLTDSVARESSAGSTLLSRNLLDAQLDTLFVKLRSTSDQNQLATIEEQIWKNWMQSGDPDIDDLLQQGTVAMEEGNLDEAIRCFDSVIDAKPEFAEGWNKRATAYYLEGDFESSLEDAGETLKREKRHFGALSGLSLIYSALGEDLEVLKALEAIREIYPNKPGLQKQIESLQGTLGIRRV